MKKNKMLRIASVLLVAVMMSTCAISGTFAKYVTSGEAGDSARVAKWGVKDSADGKLFSASYIHTPSDPDTTSTVLAFNSSDTLVAPGTRNDTGLTMTVTGKPEVDVHVEIAVDDTTLKDVFLAPSTYNDVTDNDGTFDVTAPGYYPVVYNLTQTKQGDSPAVIATGTMADIAAKLKSLSADYNANTELGTVIGDLKITWAWAYGEFAGVTDNDRADTYLGNLAAGLNPDSLAAGTDYNLGTAIDITITVTQID